MDEADRAYSFRFNNFFGRIGYLAVSSLFKFFIQLIIVVLYSHKLSLTDYGIYQFIWMYINFFSVLGLFGATTLMLSTPLHSMAQWIKTNRKIILSCFVVLNTLAVLFLFLYGTYFSSYEKILLVMLLCLQNAGLIAESIAIKKEQEKKLFYSNLVYTLIYAIVHFYLLFNTYSVTTLLHFVILATLVKSIILFRGFKLEDRERASPDNIGRQWLLLGINDLLGVLGKWIDKWLILFFLAPAQFAIYFNGTYEIPVFMIILGAIGSVSLVDFAKITQDHGKIVKLLFERSALLMASIVFPAFWFFLLYADAFILTVFGTKYLSSISIFKISILMLPVRIVYATTVLQVYNRTDLVVKGSVLDLIIAATLMLILYPLWGPEGLALTVVISTYIQVGYYLWHTSRLINQKVSYFFPFKKLIILLILSGFAIAATGYSVTSFSVYHRLLAGIAMCSSIIFFCLFFFRKKIYSS